MKYPISQEKCSGCSACHLVTKDISSAPLKEGEMYYQCIADAEDVCAEEGNEDIADVRECPCCGKQVGRSEMDFTRDCHGISFRLVCFECYEKLMAKGYDGELYDETDESLDEDW